MTNKSTKSVIIAIATIFAALTGCKKDESFSSFMFETTSVDFEWGQTKEIAFTTNKIGGFTTPTAPSGWTCVRSGNKVIITSPEESASATLMGSVSMTAHGDEGATLTSTIKVAIRIAEEIVRPANSYIVAQPDKRYKFNALRRGGESAETITGAVSATRLWSTSKNAIVNVSLENGYVYFATGADAVFGDANAVLAILDKDGKALWSWHIWAVTEDPTANPDIVGDYKVMNRNLGAFTSSDATPEDVARSFGLYYQWGRKDPFVGPGVWNSTSPRTLYSNSGGVMSHTFKVSDAEIGTVDWAVANPNTFIAGADKGEGSSDFGWLDFPNDQLWVDPVTGAKTIYDPCPDGWRVAPSDIWSDFIAGAIDDPAAFNVDGEYQYGWQFVNGESTIFYPAAGRRSFSPTLAKPEDNFTNVVNDANGVGYPVGFYWSSDSPRVYSLAFSRDHINPGGATPRPTPETSAAGGFPLRCVAI
ncbi:MAG: hypothetical protein LBV38_03325 [Alistipes sp.]|nr:hypothetical protein [Alistipes sp.]